MTTTNATNSQVAQITREGLWAKNPALVQLLGLCPLLAVTGTVVNALGLGLATMLVLVGSNVVVSLIRNHVTDVIRLPAFVMVIAAFTTCTELLMQAFTYELYQILGLFIALIVTNCTILGRAEAYASKNPVHLAAMDGFMMGLGFMAVLMVLGAIRELLGYGTIFADMHLLFGESARGWKIDVFHLDSGFLLAILPPGAFMVTGLLIALKNVIDQYFEDRRLAAQPDVVVGSKRVRTTGDIS